MKKAGAFLASVAAAASLALQSPPAYPSSSATNSGRRHRHVRLPSDTDGHLEVPAPSPSSGKEAAGSGRRSPADDRFAPRFDGLRFIETLVTAHR